MNAWNHVCSHNLLKNSKLYISLFRQTATAHFIYSLRIAQTIAVLSTCCARTLLPDFTPFSATQAYSHFLSIPRRAYKHKIGTKSECWVCVNTKSIKYTFSNLYTVPNHVWIPFARLDLMPAFSCRYIEIWMCNLNAYIASNFMLPSCKLHFHRNNEIKVALAHILSIGSNAIKSLWFGF